jgi:hypothetical protein
MSHRISNSAGTPVGHVFDDLPAEELEVLAARMTRVNVEDGADVIKLDDYGIAIYLIEEGEAMVVGDPREETKALGPGDVVGEISLLLTGQKDVDGRRTHAHAAPVTLRPGLRAHPTPDTGARALAPPSRARARKYVTNQHVQCGVASRATSRLRARVKATCANRVSRRRPSLRQQSDTATRQE